MATTRFDNVRNESKKLLEELGCSDISFPGFDKNGKVQISYKHEVCGETQLWQYSNITKRLKADSTVAPCSKCGAQRRTVKATIASAISRREG